MHHAIGHTRGYVYICAEIMVLRTGLSVNREGGAVLDVCCWEELLTTQGNTELSNVYIIDRFHIRQACSICLFSGRFVLFVLSIYFGDRVHFLVTHNAVVILKIAHPSTWAIISSQHNFELSMRLIRRNIWRAINPTDWPLNDVIVLYFQIMKTSLQTEQVGADIRQVVVLELGILAGKETNNYLT
jgi:hypothetical protein